MVRMIGWLTLFLFAPICDAGQLDRIIDTELSKTPLHSAVASDPPGPGPFRDLPLPLLRFVGWEKLHLDLTRHSRLVVGTAQEGGAEVELSGTRDQPYPLAGVGDPFHPSHFHYFPIHGYWVPEHEGELFSIVPEAMDFPWIRRTPQGTREVLLLVHPQSEALFAPLTSRYGDKKIEVSAIALSSFRTLLVALPQLDGHFAYGMVKTSLNEVIRGSARVLSRKESAGSVAAARVVKQKLLKSPQTPSLSILEDVFSFVPHSPGNAGMIVRQIPPELLEPTGRAQLIPFFAFFGKGNARVFEVLLRASSLSSSEFLRERIFRPYVRALIDLVFRKKVSLEAHAQNLLLRIDSATDQPILGAEFAFRDLGGVSLVRLPADVASLPPALAHAEFFYSDRFNEDAASAVEHHFLEQIVNLFTQQLSFQSDLADPSFLQWQQESSASGQLRNWMLSDLRDHQPRFKIDEFCQYGYFEGLFGRVLLEEAENQGVFLAIPKLHQEALREARGALLGALEDPRPSHAFFNFIQFLLQSVDARRL
jgi:hypothetical protein